MSGIATAMVATAVVGGAVSSSNASKAAKAQSNAANAASAQEMAMFQQNREDQSPWRERGNAAGNELSYLMGLGGAGNGTSGSAPVNQLTGSQLVDSSGGAPAYNADLYANNDAYRKAWDTTAAQHYGAYGQNYTGTSDAGWIERSLRDQLGAEFDKEKAGNAANLAEREKDPNYGSLLRNFTAADMQADPVYQSGLQFGLDEGRKGLDRSFAAKGGLLSGAAAKALTRFGNDYASTKANESYNRFNNNQTQIYNRLAGLSGTGQTAANQIADQGMKVANSTGTNMLMGGMARASSYQNQNNALQGALGGIYGAGKTAGWWGSGGATNPDGSPNYNNYSSGYGAGDTYRGYNALANGGWGIE